MSRPSKRSSLAILTRIPLLEIARTFELEASSGAKRAELVDLVASSKRASFERVLEALERDELKEICRAHGLDDGGRAKQELVDRILGHDAAPSLPGVLVGVQALAEATGVIEPDSE